MLREIYQTSGDKEDFTFSDIEGQARSMYTSFDVEKLKLGLHLAEELNLFSAWGKNQEGSEITFVKISERVVEIRRPETLWDEFVEHQMDWFVQQAGLSNSLTQTVTSRSRDGKTLRSTRSDWQELERLGSGGQSEVFLVRTPARRSEREGLSREN